MLVTDKQRIESPSSILTYMQCPRKYYYRYIKRLEQKPSIHLVLGKVVHSAIESFYMTEISRLDTEGCLETLRSRTMEYLKREWDESGEQLEKLHLSAGQMEYFYNEAMIMVDNFCQQQFNRVIAFQHSKNLSFSEAFLRLRPKTEIKMVSEKLGVMGVIDAIHDSDGKILVIDYKTSKKNELDSDCLIQLAIYALLYKELHGKVPDEVGIHFLRHREKIIPVSNELLALGEEKCNEIRSLSRDEDEQNYPQKKSGLCKYKTGECDYYEICMGK